MSSSDSRPGEDGKKPDDTRKAAPFTRNRNRSIFGGGTVFGNRAALRRTQNEKTENGVGDRSTPVEAHADHAAQVSVTNQTEEESKLSTPNTQALSGTSPETVTRLYHGSAVSESHDSGALAVKAAETQDVSSSELETTLETNSPPAVEGQSTDQKATNTGGETNTETTSAAANAAKPKPRSAFGGSVFGGNRLSTFRRPPTGSSPSSTASSQEAGSSSSTSTKEEAVSVTNATQTQQQQQRGTNTTTTGSTTQSELSAKASASETSTTDKAAGEQHENTGPQSGANASSTEETTDTKTSHAPATGTTSGKATTKPLLAPVSKVSSSRGWNTSRGVFGGTSQLKRTTPISVRPSTEKDISSTSGLDRQAKQQQMMNFGLGLAVSQTSDLAGSQSSLSTSGSQSARLTAEMRAILQKYYAHGGSGIEPGQKQYPPHAHANLAYYMTSRQSMASPLTPPTANTPTNPLCVPRTRLASRPRLHYETRLLLHNDPNLPDVLVPAFLMPGLLPGDTLCLRLTPSANGSHSISASQPSKGRAVVHSLPLFSLNGPIAAAPAPFMGRDPLAEESDFLDEWCGNLSRQRSSRTKPLKLLPTGYRPDPHAIYVQLQLGSFVLPLAEDVANALLEYERRLKKEKDRSKDKQERQPSADDREKVAADSTVPINDSPLTSPAGNENIAHIVVRASLHPQLERLAATTPSLMYKGTSSGSTIKGQELPGNSLSGKSEYTEGLDHVTDLGPASGSGHAMSGLPTSPSERMLPDTMELLWGPQAKEAALRSGVTCSIQRLSAREELWLSAETVEFIIRSVGADAATLFTAAQHLPGRAVRPSDTEGPLRLRVNKCFRSSDRVSLIWRIRDLRDMLLQEKSASNAVPEEQSKFIEQQLSKVEIWLETMLTSYTLTAAIAGAAAYTRLGISRTPLRRLTHAVMASSSHVSTARDDESNWVLNSALGVLPQRPGGMDPNSWDISLRLNSRVVDALQSLATGEPLADDPLQDLAFNEESGSGGSDESGIEGLFRRSALPVSLSSKLRATLSKKQEPQSIAQGPAKHGSPPLKPLSPAHGASGFKRVRRPLEFSGPMSSVANGRRGSGRSLGGTPGPSQLLQGSPSLTTSFLASLWTQVLTATSPPERWLIAWGGAGAFGSLPPIMLRALWNAQALSWRIRIRRQLWQALFGSSFITTKSLYRSRKHSRLGTISEGTTDSQMLKSVIDRMALGSGSTDGGYMAGATGRGSAAARLVAPKLVGMQTLQSRMQARVSRGAVLGQIFVGPHAQLSSIQGSAHVASASQPISTPLTAPNEPRGSPQKPQTETTAAQPSGKHRDIKHPRLESVSYAIITPWTKFQYKSASTTTFITIQVTMELFTLDAGGTMLLEKLLSFLRELFSSWTKARATHRLTLLLSARVDIDALEPNDDPFATKSTETYSGLHPDQSASDPSVARAIKEFDDELDLLSQHSFFVSHCIPDREAYKDGFQKWLSRNQLEIQRRLMSVDETTSDTTNIALDTDMRTPMSPLPANSPTSSLDSSASLATRGLISPLTPASISSQTFGSHPVLSNVSKPKTQISPTGTRVSQTTMGLPIPPAADDTNFMSVASNGRKFKDYIVPLTLNDANITRDWASLLPIIRNQIILLAGRVSSDIHLPTGEKSVSGSRGMQDYTELVPAFRQRLSCASSGGLLETLQLALSAVEQCRLDKDVLRTGTQIIAITPGNGSLKAPLSLARFVSARAATLSTPIQLVCLGGPSGVPTPLLVHEIHLDIQQLASEVSSSQLGLEALKNASIDLGDGQTSVAASHATSEPTLQHSVSVAMLQVDGGGSAGTSMSNIRVSQTLTSEAQSLLKHALSVELGGGGAGATSSIGSSSSLLTSRHGKPSVGLRHLYDDIPTVTDGDENADQDPELPEIIEPVDDTLGPEGTPTSLFAFHGHRVSLPSFHTTPGANAFRSAALSLRVALQQSLLSPNGSALSWDSLYQPPPVPYSRVAVVYSNPLWLRPSFVFPEDHASRTGEIGVVSQTSATPAGLSSVATSSGVAVGVVAQTANSVPTGLMSTAFTALSLYSPTAVVSPTNPLTASLLTSLDSPFIPSTSLLHPYIAPGPSCDTIATPSGSSGDRDQSDILAPNRTSVPPCNISRQAERAWIQAWGSVVQQLRSAVAPLLSQRRKVFVARYTSSLDLVFTALGLNISLTSKQVHSLPVSPPTLPEIEQAIRSAFPSMASTSEAWNSSQEQRLARVRGFYERARKLEALAKHCEEHRPAVDADTDQSLAQDQPFLPLVSISQLASTTHLSGVFDSRTELPPQTDAGALCRDLLGYLGDELHEYLHEFNGTAEQSRASAEEPHSLQKYLCDPLYVSTKLSSHKSNDPSAATTLSTNRLSNEADDSSLRDTLREIVQTLSQPVPTVATGSYREAAYQAQLINMLVEPTHLAGHVLSKCAKTVGVEGNEHGSGHKTLPLTLPPRIGTLPAALEHSAAYLPFVHQVSVPKPIVLLSKWLPYQRQVNVGQLKDSSFELAFLPVMIRPPLKVRIAKRCPSRGDYAGVLDRLGDALLPAWGSNRAPVFVFHHCGPASARFRVAQKSQLAEPFVDAVANRNLHASASSASLAHLGALYEGQYSTISGSSAAKMADQIRRGATGLNARNLSFRKSIVGDDIAIPPQPSPINSMASTQAFALPSATLGRNKPTMCSAIPSRAALVCGPIDARRKEVLDIFLELGKNLVVEEHDPKTLRDGHEDEWQVETKFKMKKYERDLDETAATSRTLAMSPIDLDADNTGLCLGDGSSSLDVRDSLMNIFAAAQEADLLEDSAINRMNPRVEISLRRLDPFSAPASGLIKPIRRGFNSLQATHAESSLFSSTPSTFEPDIQSMTYVPLPPLTSTMAAPEVAPSTSISTLVTNDPHAVLRDMVGLRLAQNFVVLIGSGAEIGTRAEEGNHYSPLQEFAWDEFTTTALLGSHGSFFTLPSARSSSDVQVIRLMNSEELHEIRVPTSTMDQLSVAIYHARSWTGLAPGPSSAVAGSLSNTGSRVQHMYHLWNPCLGAFMPMTRYFTAANHHISWSAVDRAFEEADVEFSHGKAFELVIMPLQTSSRTGLSKYTQHFVQARAIVLSNLRECLAKLSAQHLSGLFPASENESLRSAQAALLSQAVSVTCTRAGFWNLDHKSDLSIASNLETGDLMSAVLNAGTSDLQPFKGVGLKLLHPLFYGLYPADLPLSSTPSIALSHDKWGTLFDDIGFVEQVRVAAAMAWVDVAKLVDDLRLKLENEHTDAVLDLLASTLPPAQQSRETSGLGPKKSPLLVFKLNEAAKIAEADREPTYPDEGDESGSDRPQDPEDESLEETDEYVSTEMITPKAFTFIAPCKCEAIRVISKLAEFQDTFSQLLDPVYPTQGAHFRLKVGEESRTCNQCHVPLSPTEEAVIILAYRRDQLLDMLKVACQLLRGCVDQILRAKLASQSADWKPSDDLLGRLGRLARAAAEIELDLHACEEMLTGRTHTSLESGLRISCTSSMPATEDSIYPSFGFIPKQQAAVSTNEMSKGGHMDFMTPISRPVALTLENVLLSAQKHERDTLKAWKRRWPDLSPYEVQTSPRRAFPSELHSATSQENLGESPAPLDVDGAASSTAVQSLSLAVKQDDTLLDDPADDRGPSTDSPNQVYLYARSLVIREVLRHRCHVAHGRVMALEKCLKSRSRRGSSAAENLSPREASAISSPSIRPQDVAPEVETPGVSVGGVQHLTKEECRFALLSPLGLLPWLLPPPTIDDFASDVIRQALAPFNVARSHLQAPSDVSSEPEGESQSIQQSDSIILEVDDIALAAADVVGTSTLAFGTQMKSALRRTLSSRQFALASPISFTDSGISASSALEVSSIPSTQTLESTGVGRNMSAKYKAQLRRGASTASRIFELYGGDWALVRHDPVVEPYGVFHFSIQWLTTSSMSIEELCRALTKKAKALGLRVARVPYGRTGLSKDPFVEPVFLPIARDLHRIYLIRWLIERLGFVPDHFQPSSTTPVPVTTGVAGAPSTGAGSTATSTSAPLPGVSFATKPHPHHHHLPSLSHALRPQPQQPPQLPLSQSHSSHRQLLSQLYPSFVGGTVHSIRLLHPQASCLASFGPGGVEWFVSHIDPNLGQARGEPQWMSAVVAFQLFYQEWRKVTCDKFIAR